MNIRGSGCQWGRWDEVEVVNYKYSNRYANHKRWKRLALTNKCTYTCTCLPSFMLFVIFLIFSLVVMIFLESFLLTYPLLSALKCRLCLSVCLSVSSRPAVCLLAGCLSPPPVFVSARPPVFLTVRPFVCLPAPVSVVSLLLCLPTCLLVCLSYLPVCLSACPSICLPVHPFVFLLAFLPSCFSSACLSACPAVCLVCLFVCLPAYMPACLPHCSFVCISIFVWMSPSVCQSVSVRPFVSLLTLNSFLSVFFLIFDYEEKGLQGIGRRSRRKWYLSVSNVSPSSLELFTALCGLQGQRVRILL